MNSGIVNIAGTGGAPKIRRWQSAYPSPPGLMNTERVMSEEVRATIHRLTIGSLHGQLGWPLDEAIVKAGQEERRRIPRGLVRKLVERFGWQLKGARVLDVGAGYGGLVQELLLQGADAFGIEPDTDSRSLARMRLADAGFDADRVSEASGERLPFADDHFDYVISLQVLEHVRDPEAILREMYRVLKPGGRVFLSCENYLSFREPEYRVLWLPLLPKPVGAWYLQKRGRNPAFLLNHIHYTTYPQIWRLCSRVGFVNDTYDPWVNRPSRSGAFRNSLVRKAAVAVGHLSNALGTGVRVHLCKPRARTT